MSQKPDSPEAQLADFRHRIDAIDDQLIALFMERIGIIEQVAKLKNANWPRACHIRSGREGAMHMRIFEKFKHSSFSVRAAITIWRQIIGASTNIESPLKVAVLHPEHSWLARGYFGSEVHPELFATLEEAVAAVESNRCNIMLLPETVKGTWWEKVPDNIRVFAQLPILSGPLPNDTPHALALADIIPETSGYDNSLHVVNGQLKETEGFTGEQPNARWLGAYPRLIELED